MTDEIYKVNIEVINNGTGTRSSPYLYEITRGQRVGSLIVHTKEDGKYYQYHIARAGPTTVSAVCVCKKAKKCTAKLSLKFTPEGKIVLLEKVESKNENTTKKFEYNLKKNDPKARDIKYYTVIPRTNPTLHSDFCSHQVALKDRTYNDYLLALNPKKRELSIVIMESSKVLEKYLERYKRNALK